MGAQSGGDASSGKRAASVRRRPSCEGAGISDRRCHQRSTLFGKRTGRRNDRDGFSCMWERARTGLHNYTVRSFSRSHQLTYLTYLLTYRPTDRPKDDETHRSRVVDGRGTLAHTTIDRRIISCAAVEGWNGGAFHRGQKRHRTDPYLYSPVVFVRASARYAVSSPRVCVCGERIHDVHRSLPASVICVPRG